MKNKIKTIGMDFACYLLNDVIGSLKDRCGEFTCKDMGMNPDGETFISLNPPTSFKWKIFLFLDWLEVIPMSLFNYFYDGSREEYDAAVNLEYGDELYRYNAYQKALIILNENGGSYGY